MVRVGVVVVVVGLATGCADQAIDRPPRSPGPETSYETVATVLDGGEGPELCLGGVLTSLPPQCGGPPIDGWSWDDVEGEERMRGVVWGDFRVVGTYDGTTFTLTSAEPAPEDGQADRDGLAIVAPTCGWTGDVDAAVSDGDRIDAMRIAEADPAYAGLWIEYLEQPITDYEHPGPYVLVVAYTGDAAAHEAELRAVWDGPLCLLSFDRTFTELRRVQRQLSEGGAEAAGAELLSSGIDVTRNRVDLDIVVLTPEIDAALADAYGAGTVHAVAALRPVSG